MASTALSLMYLCSSYLFHFFFFNDTATTEIYTLSLHDALPISVSRRARRHQRVGPHGADDDRGSSPGARARELLAMRDRKSTRLNSSHQIISYALFCLKKKNSALGRRPPGRHWTDRRGAATAHT